MEIKMPAIGLGTYLSKDEDVYNAVKYALELGYRHIDTAAIYDNEAEIGKAIADSDVKREEIFITSKLWNSVKTYEDVFVAFQESIDKLQTTYLDLYLIHWPKSYERNAEVWRAMEELCNDGKVKAIGVSNFQMHHIEHLLETADIVPMMNQVEIHPHLPQYFLQEQCAELGIALTAYGQFAKGHLNDDETLKAIAKKYNKSVHQVMVKWINQRQIFTIPKSISEIRIRENFKGLEFELDKDDMFKIKKLNTARRYYPDPDNIPF